MTDSTDGVGCAPELSDAAVGHLAEAADQAKAEQNGLESETAYQTQWNSWTRGN